MNQRTTPRRPSRLTLGAAAALCVLLTDCGGDVTSPIDPPSTSEAVPTVLTTSPLTRQLLQPEADRAFAALEVDDEIAVLRTRFLPALSEDAAAEIGRALTRAVASAAANDRPATLHNLAVARAAFREGAGGAADLDAGRRTIDAMRQAIDASTP
jgi:hypothetical protein